jgi:hypothetical protein
MPAMCIDLHASDFFQFETVLCVIQLAYV